MAGLRRQLLAEHMIRQLSDDVQRALIVAGNEVFFRTADGAVYRMGVDGTDRRKALPGPVVLAYDVSPDRNWVSVEDSVAFESVKNPTVLYPLNAQSQSQSRIPLCPACAVFWVAGGRYLHVQFYSRSPSEDRMDYLLPLSQGEILPPLFRTGHLVTEEEIATAPGVLTARQGAAFRASGIETYAFTKRTVHRNIFRIPLE